MQPLIPTANESKHGVGVGKVNSYKVAVKDHALYIQRRYAACVGITDACNVNCCLGIPQSNRCNFAHLWEGNNASAVPNSDALPHVTATGK